MNLPDVVTTFRRHLYLPDPGALYANLGTFAANRAPGDPVWLLTISPPGGGKTELLGSLSKLPDVHWAATLTEASLLSGTPARQRVKEASGGLLRQIGDFGIVVCKDFTSILAQNKDTRGAVLAALREVFDGSWTRHVGTDGGRVLHWAGKVGLIGGCTPAIDSAHGVIASMGDRFVFYRLPAADDDTYARQAMQHYGGENSMRAELADAVRALFDTLPERPVPRELEAWEERALIGYATFAARARSAVERDSYSREVEAVPAHEVATRLALTFRRLLAGLEVIGTPADAKWEVIVKVALDSMPSTRLAVLEAVKLTPGCRTSGVALSTELPNQTARRALEDLTLHGVVRREKEGNSDNSADRWWLTDWAFDRWPTVPESPAAVSGVPESPYVDCSVSSSFYSSSLRKEGITGTLQAGAG